MNQLIALFLKHRWQILVYASLAAMVSGMVCWSVFFPHWLAHDIVPPGDDPVVHLGIITKILDGKGIFVGLPYPPLFHWLVAATAFVLPIDPLQALWLIVTALVGLIPLCVGGIFVYRLSGQRAIPLITGMTTTLILFLLSRQPLRAWGDGNYSNMFAEGLLIPLFIAALIHLNASWTTRRAAAVIGTLALIFLTHAMSIVVALTIFAIALLALDTSKRNKLILASPVIGLIAVAWIKVIQPEVSLKALSQVFVGSSNIIPGLAADTSAVTGLAQFGVFFGQPFLAITLTLLCLAVTMYLVDKSTRFTLLCLFAWAGTLFLISRISGFAVPDRFLRDLSYPLIALGAVSVTLLANRQAVASLPIVLLLALLAGNFAPYIPNQPGTFAAHPDGIRAILQRADRPTALALKQLTPLIPANAIVITNRTTSYAPYLLQQNAVALGEPAIGDIQTPYYILIGPEPGGSLRSPQERLLFQQVTAYLQTIPGSVIKQDKFILLKYVTPTLR